MEEIQELKGKEELGELLLLYDNLVEGLDSGKTELYKESAQRLYNIYDAMTDILKDNLDR